MSHRIIIRAIADDDIAQAAKWYERKAGLGHDFVASVRGALDKLQKHPSFGIIVFKHMRRLRRSCTSFAAPMEKTASR